MEQRYMYQADTAADAEVNSENCVSSLKSWTAAKFKIMTL